MCCRIEVWKVAEMGAVVREMEAEAMVVGVAAEPPVAVVRVETAYYLAAHNQRNLSHSHTR